MTTITVLDSNVQTRQILEGPADDRLALLQRMYEPAIDMYAHMPQPIDLLATHYMGSGFRIDRDDPRAFEGLRMLEKADAWGRVQRALERGVGVLRDALPDAVFPDEIRVLIVLDDPDDEHLMTVNRGYTAMGAISGFIHIGIWPTEENLARLEGLAVHELHHNIRYTNVVWNPMTVKVGEQVVSEGLADAFARDLYGDLGLTLIGLPSHGDQAVFDKLVTGLEISGMQNLAAWVHGDASARRFGGEPVGLPTGAGYAVGLELVRRYTDAAGISAARAALVDSAELIRVALATD